MTGKQKRLNNYNEDTNTFNMKEDSDLQLSIIVPVYNVEKFIRACMESIFKQGLDEKTFEVIIVNDGTQDRSMEVIQDFIEQHKNITVINQENQGLSMARNNGMAIARGKYILMPDSDDLLVENSVKPLLEKALETKADMVVADFLEMNDEQINHFTCPKQLELGASEMTGKELYLYQNHIISPVWRTLYRREFLNDNSLRFIPNTCFEDTPFTNECYLKANLCIKTNVPIYIYRVGHSSISSPNAFTMKKAHDLCIVTARIWELKKIEGLSSDIINKIDDVVFSTFSKLLNRSLYRLGYSQKVAVIKMLKREVPDLRFTHGFKQKLDYLFYRTSSHLYIIWRILIKRLIWHHSPKADDSGVK